MPEQTQQQAITALVQTAVRAAQTQQQITRLQQQIQQQQAQVATLSGQLQQHETLVDKAKADYLAATGATDSLDLFGGWLVEIAGGVVTLTPPNGTAVPVTRK